MIDSRSLLVVSVVFLSFSIDHIYDDLEGMSQ